MGIHTYNCPTCQSAQRIRAEAGQVVEIKDCQACAEAKRIAQLDDEALESEVVEALDELVPQKRKR